jgi:hypothetical protein
MNLIEFLLPIKSMDFFFIFKKKKKKFIILTYL